MNTIKTFTDQRNYSMIYHDFLDNNFLNGSEKLVFILLKRFSDSEGKCFPSLNRLIALSSFSKNKILRILKSLEEKEVISIEHRKTDKGNKSNIYTLYDYAEKWQKKELSHATTTDAQKSPHQYKIDNIDNKTVEKESQAENQDQECADSKNIENADIENEDIEKKSHEEKRAEQEEREKDQNGSGSGIERHLWLSGHSESKEVLESYEELIKKNIEYDNLCNAHQHDKAFVDELISNILDVVVSNNKTIKIANEYKNAELVKSVLLKLNYYQIEHVIQKYHQITTRITNKRQYILTMLYNARLESESSVINDVNVDMFLPDRDDKKKDIEILENYLL